MQSTRTAGPPLSVGLTFCDTQWPNQSWQVLGWDDDQVNFWRPMDQHRQTLTMADWHNAWEKGWLMLRA